MRRFAPALVATIVALTTTPLGIAAQSVPPAAPASTFVHCKASVVAAQAGPGLYAVATTAWEPLDEVTVRLDGATAHWIYALTSPHQMLAIPNQGEVLGVAVVGTRHGHDAPVTCGPQVGQIAGDIARAPILDALPQGVPAVQPTVSAVDAPLDCAHPFAPMAVLHAVPPALPMPGSPLPASGIVRVELDVDPKGTIVGASVASSTAQILNADAVATARKATIQAPTYRCQPMGGSSIFTVEYERQ
jgi:TonB family protein